MKLSPIPVFVRDNKKIRGFKDAVYEYGFKNKNKMESEKGKMCMLIIIKKK